MLLTIKLYGGLICLNKSLDSCGLRTFSIELPQNTTLAEVHRLLRLKPPDSLVSMVNGHTQSYEYVLHEDCNISIFPPMADRQYNFFERL